MRRSVVPNATIIDLLEHPVLGFSPPSSWKPWHAALSAAYGLPLDDEGLALYRRHTARVAPPSEQAREAWFIVGRRGGKSRIAALVAVHAAFFRDWRPFLAPGERATIMVLASDKDQARVVFRYVDGLIESVPAMARHVEARPAEKIELDNRVSIEIRAASYRGTRGYSLAAVIADEIAFWRSDESSNPDTEILKALRPGMASIPGSMLVGISSPYSRRGVLWDVYRRHHGKDGSRVLVWQASTEAMNPELPVEVIREAFEEDPASAAAEYGAEFRTDVESFVSREVVEAAVCPGRRELPPMGGTTY
jgi:hypothetical protein